MTKVAIIGNTHRNIGAVCAADLSLAGHDVSYHLFAEDAYQLQAIKDANGLDVKGDISNLISKRLGKAKFQICDEAKDALFGAQVVMLDLNMAQLEQKFKLLLPWLPKHAVVYVQSFGYWVAARLTTILRVQGRDDVLIFEGSVPTHHGALSGAAVCSVLSRRGVAVATIPGAKGMAGLRLLQTVFPDLIAAPTVLQTSLESMNLMVHPAMVLFGIGHLEYAESKGEKVPFYRECNVPSAGRLAEALDRERGRICKAYGVRHRPLPAAIEHFYGAKGDTVQEAILNCAGYQSIPPGSPTVWREWESVDVPYAIVPLVLLGEQAGVGAPLHRALAEILGTALEIDPWAAAPSLKAMDLVGSPDEVVRRCMG